MNLKSWISSLYSDVKNRKGVVVQTSQVGFLVWEAIFVVQSILTLTVVAVHKNNYFFLKSKVQKILVQRSSTYSLLNVLE